MTAETGSELPPGWSWATVAELAESTAYAITDGPFGSNLKTEHYTVAGPRVIRLQNIGHGTFVDSRAHISQDHFDRLRRHEVRSGDVVIAALGESLPRACIIPPSIGPAIVKADCIRLRPDAQLAMPPYLSWALNSEPTRQRTATTVHGIGRPRLNLAEVKAIRLPVAPLEEQRRIVNEIEKHFTRLDAAVVALKRSHANLKRYRAAVLKAACEGRLVPTEAELARREGREYESADGLLERILAERRARWEAAELTRNQIAGIAPKAHRWAAKYSEPAGPGLAGLHDLPEGWCWARVEQVGEVKIGRQRSPKHHTGPHMRPYLRVANVFDDRLDLSDVMWMNFDRREFEEYRLASGDILLNEGQSPELLGRPALFRGELTDVCFQNTLVRFRSSPQLVPEYALLVFRSYMHNGRFRRLSRQTTNIAHLGGDRFAKTEFPLPPIAEQRRIVAEAERVLSIAKKMDEASISNVKRANAMRQAILKRAFDGKLVPQDPNDEPASVVMQRIRAQREADQQRQNGRTRRRARVDGYAPASSTSDPTEEAAPTSATHTPLVQPRLPHL